MPRDLTRHNDNKLTLLDSISGTEIEFTYSTPGTVERVAYQAARFRREGTRMINCSRKAAINAAAGVLTGIREGDFAIEGQPLSSDPTSPNYREDWKRLIKDMAGDLLFIMGNELFEGKPDLDLLQGLTFVDEADEPADETDGGEIPPLATSSGD